MGLLTPVPGLNLFFSSLILLCTTLFVRHRFEKTCCGRRSPPSSPHAPLLFTRGCSLTHWPAAMLHAATACHAPLWRRHAAAPLSGAALTAAACHAWLRTPITSAAAWHHPIPLLRSHGTAAAVCRAAHSFVPSTLHHRFSRVYITRPTANTYSPSRTGAYQTPMPHNACALHNASACADLPRTDQAVGWVSLPWTGVVFLVPFADSHLPSPSNLASLSSQQPPSSICLSLDLLWPPLPL